MAPKDFEALDSAEDDLTQFEPEASTEIFQHRDILHVALQSVTAAWCELKLFTFFQMISY